MLTAATCWIFIMQAQPLARTRKLQLSGDRFVVNCAAGA